jgi:hypothetical protein
VDVTSSWDALNGYQKGRCFYCFREIAVDAKDDPSSSSSTLPQAEVDHFFPKALDPYLEDIYVDGVWNLVLSCPHCNRGLGGVIRGKFDRLPEIRYLRRLERRNNFLIESHHPLRETLKRQTGNTTKRRRAFLQEVTRSATNYQPHTWAPLKNSGTDLTIRKPLPGRKIEPI